MFAASHRYGFAAGSLMRFSTCVLASPGPPWMRISAPRLSTAQPIRSGANEYGRNRA